MVNVIIEDDNGNEVTIRCTKNHRFLGQDGNYVEAQYLREGFPLKGVTNCEN